MRIMYVHVPSAWLALSGYLGLGLSALFFIVWKHQLADIAAQAIMPVGAGFALICLITGTVGQAYLGYLLGVGCTADLNAGAVSVFHWIWRAKIRI